MAGLAKWVDYAYFLFIHRITAGNITITQDEYGLVVLERDGARAEYCHSAYSCNKMLTKSVGFSAGTSDSAGGGMTTESFIKAGGSADFILEIRCDRAEYCGTIIGKHVNPSDGLDFALEFASGPDTFLTDTHTTDIIQKLDS